GAGDIGGVVINIGVVDHGSLIIYLINVPSGDVVVMDVSTYQSFPGDKDPIVAGDIHRHVNTYARHQGSPSIIIPVAPPIDPGRTPFITWYPSPTEVIIKIPPSIVKGRPSPVIVRDPGVAVSR